MALIQTPFQPFRRAIVVADAAVPTTKIDRGALIDCFTWETVVFQMNYTNGGGATALNVTPLWWDGQQYDSSGNIVWSVDSEQGRNEAATGYLMFTAQKRGRWCWLRVDTISGAAPNCDVQYALQKGKG